MSFFGNNNAASSSLAAASNATQPDIEVADAPDDSISSMAFCPVADYLAVGSWNNQVRIYEVTASGQTQGKAMYQHEAPVLSVCWNKDGNKLFSGGADKAGRAFDVSTGQSSQVAQHDAPIKCVKWIEAPTGGILVTGSWDKTLKYWDLRTPNPVATVNLPERCYTLDVQYPLMVVGTAERHIQIFNLSNPSTPYRQIVSPLKWQTRVVSCFPAANGFAVGSIEGRVAIQYVEDKDSSSNFSFKCHRKDQAKDQTLVYSVNDISFHQGYGTFSTAGADGTINFWDKDARSRIKPFDAAPGPISATCFNRNGNIFAYAVSYDWSKGHSGMVAGHPNKIMLHPCKDDEVKRRAKK
ncbi:WD40 repeat-like protein [Exidia glandulosa HHB12029]|uniref:WD40 repeat-like protein n=1 Tax=Exidia glandulosa HHB12029 TaxID=1314781 RepID=A0A165GIF2_EXIGL|nr:WD40 repeat-like protein [Exidia glandulosa HHB12029]